MKTKSPTSDGEMVVIIQIVENLRQRRWTVPMIATAIGVSPSTIYCWLKDERRPGDPVETMQKLSALQAQP